MAQKKPEVFISLVVATVDRMEEPVQLLESLRKVKGEDFEVILVDQNDHNQLEQVCKRYEDELLIKYLRLPERNASKARNLGASNAAGKWVGFPDDDCVYTLNTLSELRKTIDRNSFQLIAGAILDFDSNYLSRTYKRSCQLSIFNVVGRVPEPCFFIERKVFFDLNGFDESFGPGSLNFAGEGMELGLKAVKRGVQMYFNADIQVLHLDKFRDIKQADLTKVYKYSYANASSIAKHFSLLSYMYLFRYLVLFFPMLLFKYKPGKLRFLMSMLLGYYDGTVLKKHRLTTL